MVEDEDEKEREIREVILRLVMKIAIFELLQ
jgi:hypothetical protein